MSGHVESKLTVDQKNQKWLAPFALIWGGQAFSLIGTEIVQFALIWWLTELTGSATVLATATTIALIPRIVLGPIAGTFVDRWNRRVIMIVADSIICLASLWLAYHFWMGTMQIWHVYVIMLIRSLGGIFHRPAMTASTSLMVPKEHLSRVAGFNQVLSGSINIIGAPLGALFMSLWTLDKVILIDVFTAILAIGPLFFVKIPQPVKQLENRVGVKSVIKDMKEGLDYLRGWKSLVAIVIMALAIKIALTPAFSLLPLYINQHFGATAAQYSLTEACAGAGIIVGGLIIGVWGGFKKKIVTMLGGLLGMGVSLFALGLLSPNMFIMTTVLAFLVGAMIPLFDGPYLGILQAKVAPEMQGRFFAILSSIITLTSPISLSIAGPLSDRFGLQYWYIFAGVVCFGAAIVAFSSPLILNFENGPEEEKLEEMGLNAPVYSDAQS
jgi:DHA3 family macrolide efflux protein-like MFS transporter